MAATKFTPESIFEDDTIIDFGKHKDSKLEDVPAQWLLWWHGENKHKLNDSTYNYRGLILYIDDCMDAIVKEAKIEKLTTNTNPNQNRFN